MDSVELRLNDAVTFLSWLSDEDLPEPVRESLLKADAMLRAQEYQAAHDLCRQAINQVSSKSLSEIIYASASQARVHLGAVYYPRGDGYLDDAVEAFTTASKELSSRHRAQAVAEFALGATYAWKGERTRIYEHITPEVLSTLKWYPAAKELDAKWEEIRGRLNDSPPRELEPPDRTSAEGTKDKESAARQYLDLTDPAVPREQPPSMWDRIVIPAAICVTLFVGAILAYLLSNRNAIALLGYVLAVSIATYLIVKRLECKAERDCALVIETGSGHKVRWGPTTYYRWPFSEHVRALVPLHPLQYTTPAKSIQLGAKAKVDLRLVVYFRVNTSNREMHQNEENVLNSVYRVQLERTNNDDRSGAKPDSSSYTVDDLRRIWEKRLLKDIIATMIEVLPGRSCDELTGQDIQARTKIIDEARLRLAARVHQWGMEIRDMGILDAATNKA